MIGEILDNRYRVLRMIGGGGMGEVYLVDNLELGRREALKILRAHAFEHAQFVARFRREARAMNRLSHPNIVTVYDFGSLPEGRLYLAMEHADGKDLAQILDEEDRVSSYRVVRILHQLADALDHAHARGVIHRDIKPENMIVVQRYGETDILKIMDFGIAKIVASDYVDTSPTSQGLRCGTPAYMAPEQFGETADDPRIDIYALGCIGFELLTGRPPFEGGALELFQAHMLQAPPRPSLLARTAHISKELEDIILRCLAKSPGERFQRGADVATALAILGGTLPRTDLRGATRAATARESPPSPRARARSHGPRTAEGNADLGATEVDDPRDWPQVPDASLGDHDSYASIVCQLADALSDRGCSDLELVLGVAGLRELHLEVEGLRSEAGRLRQERIDIERQGRENEAALRFATSEIRFDSAPRSGEAENAVRAQIAGLQSRVAEVARRAADAVAEVVDREIALAATVSRKQDELATATRRLDGLLSLLIPSYLGDRVVGELTARLRDARRGSAAAG